jgi:hypothetical protein
VVLTSLHDDEVGGDTQKNGAAEAPQPGDWAGLVVDLDAGPSTVEHLRARYGAGGSAFAAIDTRSADAVLRSVRADHALRDGIRGKDHAGYAVQWVAFACAQDGIELSSGATFDLLHPTVSACGGVGVRKQLGHVGALRNGIAFGNAGAEVAGFQPGEVFHSNVGAAFAGFDGNIAADPLFTDAATGDLGLLAGSPCIGAADLSTALTVPADHVDASRVLDSDLNGAVEADMGAFERAPYVLTFGGEPRAGTTMTFTVDGAWPGVAVFFLGPTGGEVFEDPFGFRLHGPQAASVVAGFAPTGTAIDVAMPPGGLALGERFGVQAYVRPIGRPAEKHGGAAPRLGAVSNLWAGRLLP